MLSRKCLTLNYLHVINVAHQSSLRTAGALEIWIGQLGFSRRGKEHWPDVNVCQQERHWSRASFLLRDAIFMNWKWFRIPETTWYCKKDVTFYVSQVFTFVRHKKRFFTKNGSSASSNLLVVRPVLPLRKTLVGSWAKKSRVKFSKWPK